MHKRGFEWISSKRKETIYSHLAPTLGSPSLFDVDKCLHPLK